jgi:hypothetical protein
MNATALPRRVVYLLGLPSERNEAAAEACRELMEQERVWVDRLKPSPKQLNIHPYFRTLSVIDNTLSLDLWVTQTGTARADELLRLLGLDDLLEAGYVLNRDVLEVRDELDATKSTDQPPDGPAETLPLNHAIREETPLPAASHFAPMVE